MAVLSIRTYALGLRSRPRHDRRCEQGPISCEEHRMYLAPTARLRSSPTGLAAILGPLRAEILATLWQHGRATARDVHRQQRATRQHPYGTIRRAMQHKAAD